MPLPTPKNDEEKDGFISRCMADSVMNEEFPENGQRYAVCQRQWEDKNKENRMPQNKRWFSTGFMGGGVESVDAEKHTLHNAVVVRVGEVGGHDLWIDQEFCSRVVELGNRYGDKGLKARFGHPNMCSDAMGTFLGRWKNLSMGEDGYVRGDLFLSSTAAESPKGDLRKYIEEMAVKEPLHFGASMVFTRDEEAENVVFQTNGGGTEAGFKSPDPANGKNLPHARCAELHAADLVDDPAATDGMFAGAAGFSLAAQMTEWLDTHPEVFRVLTSEPEILDLLIRYQDELKPFLARYQEMISMKSPDAAETAPVETPSTALAEPDAGLAAKMTALEAQHSADQAEIARLAGELAGVVETASKAQAAAHEALQTKCAELAETASRLNQTEAEKQAAISERDEAMRKLAAIEAGAPPVSAKAAEKGNESDPWRRAQKAMRKQ